jgi:hypothetical protein
VGEILLALVLVVLLFAGGCVASVALLLHALAVRNRVVQGHRSPAPLRWLVAPEPAARLHRRLQRAVALTDAAQGDLGLDDVVGQLRERALELDEQLVLAGRAPKVARRRLLRELQAEVAELERLAERTVRMSRAWAGGSPSERGLAAVRERLELLEAALHELDGVDVVSARSAVPPAPARRQA